MKSLKHPIKSKVFVPVSRDESPLGIRIDQRHLCPLEQHHETHRAHAGAQVQEATTQPGTRTQISRTWKPLLVPWISMDFGLIFSDEFCWILKD